ncbi:polyamine ABC transporter substrate-binding protein [Methyloradius palustris]|uniref:Putrescine-binding periplasmic protein n=1 Tax=Methyloradius palustris TaxID=2778876 RepID=A0A8D5GCN5_9PROT|nr:polyamine ABC transporter substrate-binding protein [Methyloradius palustris]BCM25023.1 putrescine-binding periplasmic protein [Methyloradius palustris]
MISHSKKRLPNKKQLIAVIAAAITGLGMISSTWAAEEKILNIYNWSDYLAPDTIPNFEKETGIKVRYDVFDSNEILHAKLVAGKTGYDIVVPSSNWAKLQIEGGLFQKLDKSQLSNYKNLDPNIMGQIAKLDPGNTYLVDWLWSYDTVGINVDKVKKALGDTPMPDNIWDLVFDPKYASKLKSCGINFLDTASDIFPIALNYIGKDPYSKDPADYQAAYDMLKKVRPYIKKFNSGGEIEEMASGGSCASLGWAGDFNLARKRSIENKSPQNIVALVPKSGGLLFMDTMAIPADAKHPENAHKFINYILRPQVHAGLTNAVTYANPNKAATQYVDPEIRNNKSIYLPDDVVSKMIPPGNVDNATRRTMTRYFTRFKTGV